MPNWYASAASVTSVRTKAELRAVTSPLRTAGGVLASRKLWIRPKRGRTCVASSMQHRATLRTKGRAQTEVWRAAMSHPIVSFNEGQLSNGQTNQRWRTPKMIDRRALISVGLATGLASWSAPARAEVGEVHLVRQFGIGYLPLTIMLHEKLVEKHAAKAGLPALKTKWSVRGNAVPINDGLIAGTIHFGSGGIAPMVTVWDRTRGNVNIHGIGALCALPIFLVSRHPYKSVKEFTDQDRISMAGAGQSIQTMYLQMELVKEYGISE